jgi:hypothetical protein
MVARFLIYETGGAATFDKCISVARMVFDKSLLKDGNQAAPKRLT